MRILTHSGTFHADDVFSSVVLREALGEVELVRSRDPQAIAAADLVFDVGGVYDPAARRYDHHMRDRPLRPDGTPFSAVGLIWRDYGRAALSRLLAGPEDALVQSVWSAVDASLVIEIDRADNGVVPFGPGHVSALIEAFNPVWDSDISHDDAFREAAETARGILQRACRQAHAAARAVALVRAAAERAPDPRIVVLDRKLPWEKAIFERGLDQVLFLVYPNEDGTAWYCRTVPPEPNSFGQRLSLPEPWRGLQDEAFSRASGIADGTFCHPSGFICGARSRTAAVRLAEKAIEAGEA